MHVNYSKIYFKTTMYLVLDFSKGKMFESRAYFKSTSFRSARGAQWPGV